MRPTFSVAIGTIEINKCHQNTARELQLFPQLTFQSLGDRFVNIKISKLLVSPNECLNNIILERTIEYTTTQPQNSTAKESNATSEINAHGKKDMAYSRAYMFVASDHMSQLRYQFTSRDHS